MSLFLGILLAFLVFLIVVVVHEFGHFSTARLTGMKVQEFWFGLPPLMIKLYKDAKWTLYSWNWLPIGGFVRILGEDPTGEDAHKKWAFMTRPWAARVLVLVAGVTMNFLLAFFIFTWLFWTGASPVTVNPLSDKITNSFFIPSLDEAIYYGYVQYDGVEISSLSGSIAEKAGIWTGEIVYSINWFHVVHPDQLIEATKQNQGLDLILYKDGGHRVVQITPQDGKIGVRVWFQNLRVNPDFRVELPFWRAVQAGAYETYNSSILTLIFLKDLVHGIFAPDTPEEREDAKNMLSGPIGVGATFVWLVEISAPVGLILVVIALISINLGVVNLLPIPALDGGRIVTTTFYSLIVRHNKEWVEKFLQFEKYFHAFGFLLLMALTIYVAGLDISRFF